MKLLMFYIVVNLVLLSIASGILSFAIRPFFKDLGVRSWRSVVPFYNIYVWFNVLGYPGWFVLLLFMPYWLPLWWVYGISAFVAGLLAFQTIRLYRPVKKPLLYAGMAGLGVAMLSQILSPSSGLGVIITPLLFGVLMHLRRNTIDRKRLFESRATYRNRVWNQFRKNRPAVWSIRVLAILVLVAAHAPYIANDQPLVVKYNGKTLFPAWVSITEPTRVEVIEDKGEKEELQYDIVDWREKEVTSIAWPLIAYDDRFQDKYNRGFVSPDEPQFMRNQEGEIVEMPSHLRHSLGTDQAGRDVAAGLIYGSRYSLLIGIIAMGIAGVIGIFLGAIGGYFGDHGWRLKRGQVIAGICGLVLGYFYAFIARDWRLTEALEEGTVPGFMSLALNLFIFLAIPCAFVWLTGLSKKEGWINKPTKIPVDALLLRLLEVFNSIPRLLLIIVVAAVVSEPSIWLVVVVIGLTAWTGVARFMRAEMLKIREMDYIEAARALGYSDAQIIWNHALPNALAPVMVTLAFGIAGAILIESGLSFLGIGIPQDIVTWGSLLNAGRQSFESWWLIVFPGFAIFLTIMCFNLVGDGIRDAIDPR